MRRRTLITALAATAAFGAATAPAHAELRRVKVTLVTGQQLTLAVNVPLLWPYECVIWLVVVVCGGSPLPNSHR